MPQDNRDCREIFALLSDYLDLELPPESCDRMRDHIENCAPCVEFVESLRRTVDLCRKYEPSTMPSAMSSEARERLLSAWRKASLPPGA
jgi:hypothetical protein